MGRRPKILMPPPKGTKEKVPSAKEHIEEKIHVQSEGLKEQITSERANLRTEYTEAKSVDEAKDERGKYVKKADRIAQAEAAAKLQKETEDMAGLATHIVNAMCERLPKPKPLSDVESGMLESSVQKVLAKHWERMGEWSPEFSLAIVAGMIFVPRLQKPKNELNVVARSE